MDFKKLEYKRADIQDIISKIENIEKEFKNLSENGSKEEIIELYKKYDNLLEDYSYYSTLAYTRSSMDTTDKFYEAEQAFYDENSPILEKYSSKITKIILNSDAIKNALKEEYGEHLINLIESSDKVFDDKIVPLLQEENKLSTEYTKLVASAKIEYDGKILNLTQMTPYTQSTNREIRKEATKLIYNFFNENMEKIDQIYDSLVKNRDKQAKELGFKNYVEMAYLSLKRTDYNHLDVKNYRKQVLEILTPVYVDLIKKQEKRLNLDSLKIYDMPLSFLTGNPTPKGDRKWQVEKATKMYNELSKETSDFFNMMVNSNLMDLDIRQGKAGGGYCTSIPKINVPFIFANFNGTSHDVTVLTHEAGHAFQVYEAMKTQPISSYYWPTYEACEIHSMSMEFLTWPWMKDFFIEDTNKFMFEHIEDSLKFIPYGVTVDEFQHFVYENPNATPKERRMKWMEIEKKYRPTIDYDDIDTLNNGIFWFKQAHIFNSPFYYIDYTLAQVCAFQFLINSREDREKTWSTYLNLCKLGGSLPFTKLIEKSNLLNPFNEGTLEKIIPKIKEILDTFDDTKM